MYFADQNLLESMDSTGLRFSVFEMQKSNKSTSWAQRVDEKNNVIRLVMLTSKLWSIECQKYSFCVLSAEYRKKQTQFGQDI